MKAFLAGIALAAAMTLVSTAWGACRNYGSTFVDGGAGGSSDAAQALGQAPAFCFDVALSAEAATTLGPAPLDSAIAGLAAPQIRDEVRQIAQAGALLANHSPVGINRVQFTIVDPYGEGQRQSESIVDAACDPVDAQALCLKIKPGTSAQEIQSYLVSRNRMQAVGVWTRMAGLLRSPRPQPVQISDTAQVKLLAGQNDTGVEGVRVSPSGSVSLAR